MGALPSNRGQIHRRRAFAIGGFFTFGSGRNQHIRQRQVVIVGGPLHRRGAIGLRRVDVRLLLDQRLDRRQIAASWPHRPPGWTAALSPPVKYSQRRRAGSEQVS